MEKENSSPIQTILNGSNYLTWSQAMRSYLKGKRLWRYVNGDFTIPTKEKDETDSKFKDRIEEWDVKNHQAITYFRNSSVSKINLQFGNYETAKEIWDLLASRYTVSDLSHQYQIMSSLNKQKQESGQPVADFLSQIQSLWDQLTLSEPKWLHTDDATLYQTYRDQQRLIQFLMALTPDFEPVRAALLHRVPLPSLEGAIAELISEETRLGIGKPNHVTDTVLAVPPSSSVDKPICKFCRQHGHQTKDCMALRNHTCQHCHQKGHYSIAFCKKRPSFHSQKFSHPSAAATSESTSESTPNTSTSELEALLRQVLSKTSSPSTAFSVISGNSWYFDSACCNHMTNDPHIFTSKIQSTCLPNIQTADGSTMNVTHIGTVSTEDLSLPNTYYVPNLSLNLISIGQLCDLGLHIIFTASGCHVQDPQTGRTLGTGRRCGRLFELTYLHLPSLTSSSHLAGSVSSTSTIWHSRYC
nr:PREDICTED: uncharacterized protein LOC108214919 isoform X3 [Daucus carota subsp. sativus]